ncbi:hypothetical protein C6P43_002482 [Kluyveromyces marxianus]|nr:hypothetical protein C6P43_002482 [Kluyveromyces marxianus]
MPSDKSPYNKWTKEQLIERLLQLEKKFNENSIEEASTKNTVGARKRAADNNGSENERNSVKKPKRAGNLTSQSTTLDLWPSDLHTWDGTIMVWLFRKTRHLCLPWKEQFWRRWLDANSFLQCAMNQVISLKVRSNLTPEQQLDPSYDNQEIQYVNILNQLLPEDIRVSAVCLRPPKGFDARFSCISRHYKYLFSPEGLDLDKMKRAAKHFEGEHDFRNFCKLDGSKQITNYKRTIISAKITKINEDIYCFDLIGSAFLWHQVRCMMANLFLVGQGLEEDTIILEMLNVEDMPRKPIYEMASDIPLVLYDCKFPAMEWIIPDQTTDKASRSSAVVNSVELNYKLKASVSMMYRDILPKAEIKNKTVINVGDGIGKVVNVYQKLADRSLMDSFEVVNEKYRQRKIRNPKEVKSST